MAQLTEQVREYFRALDAGEFDRAEEMLAPDCDFEAPGFSARTPESIMGWIQAFMVAFPDVRHDLAAIAADGDIACVELRIRGTHTAPLASPTGEVAPTGRAIDLRVADVLRVRDGRIAAYHIYFDRMEFLGQLGLVPEPAAAA
jgi:ketosteroid isomerase-like protein